MRQTAYKGTTAAVQTPATASTTRKTDARQQPPNRFLELRAFGDQEFDLREGPVPQPGPGEVRIRVLAASVQFTDTVIRRGKYPMLGTKPPFIPGYDFVGEVDAVGPGVTQWRKGDRVADLTVYGSYARYVVRDAAKLTAVPANVDPAAATTLMLSWMTAYQMMFRVCRLDGGERILVHAAGGAVGDAALQLAQLRGVEVVGTARPHHHDRIRSLGATPVDYQSDWEGHARQLSGGAGFDAVLDPVGEDGFSKSWSLVRRGGRLVVFGFQDNVATGHGSLAWSLGKFALWNLLPNGKKCSMYSIAPLRRTRPKWWTEDLGQLLRLLVTGQIEPRVQERLTFEQVADAHRRLQTGGLQGKLVLEPG